MSFNPEHLPRLVEEVGRFHLRRGVLQRAQARMAAEIATDAAISAKDLESYLQAVRRYFKGFEQEARTHLKDLDRRLAHVSQLQCNLSAEHGVALKRVEATQGVLAMIQESPHPVNPRNTLG